MDTQILAFMCSIQLFNFTFLPGDELDFKDALYLLFTTFNDKF